MGRNRKLTLTSGPAATGKIDFKPLSGDSDPLNGVTLKGPDSVGASPLDLTLPNAVVDKGVYKSDSTGNQSVALILDENVDASAAITRSKLAALTPSRALVADGSGVIDVSNVTDTELGYVSGVTSGIQGQIDGKEPTITQLPISQGGTNSVAALNNNRVMQSSGGAIVEASAITASRALASDANGIPVAGAPTATELDYLAGVANTNGGVVYGNGTALRTTAAGSSGQVLQSNGAAAPTWATLASAPRSEIWCDTGNGHGSPNTCIRRWSNNPKNTGTAITYGPSGNGDTFTINEDGLYSISYSDARNGATTKHGISVNSTQLSTSVYSITTADVIQLGGSDNSNVPGGTMVFNVSATVFLQAGDVIRAHDDGNCNEATHISKFIIMKVNS